MKCFKCGSEWKSKVDSKVCPFCGEELQSDKSKNVSFTNISTTLKYIVDTYGIETYKNTTLLLAYVSDLAPRLNAERRLIKMCAESGVINQIANLHNINIDEQEIFIRKATVTLCEQYFLNEKASKDVLSWLTYGVGWINDIEKEENNGVRQPLTVEVPTQAKDEELVIEEEQNLENLVELSKVCSELQADCDSLLKKCNEALSDINKDFGDGIIISPFDELKYKELSTEKHYYEAIKEYNKENYEKAFTSFSESLAIGNYFAFAHVGLMYHFGEGCIKDDAVAFELFKKGTSLGCPLAAAWLTELLRFGKGCHKKDKELAKKIFVGIETDLMKMCNLGDGQALYFLGSGKLWGILTNEDIPLGLKCIEEAYSKGVKRAGIVLGECYLYGNGTETDENKAFELLHQNQTDYSRGKYLLGLCYFVGRGTNENEEKAFDLFKEAAEGGYGRAKVYLGDCYEYGLGTIVDYRKAFMWYKDAADNHENASAELAVAKLYKTGRGVERNEQLAREYFLLAAEKDLAEAQYFLGHEYLVGELFKEDKNKAIYWLEKAANQNDVESQVLLGRLYVGEPFNDEKKAFKWFLKAANQKNAEAEYIVGACYENEVGTSKDMIQANKWYRKAAGKNHPEACYELGLNYIYGEGVEKKEEYGISLLKRAVDSGNDKAKLFLSKRYINEGKEYFEAFNLLNSIDFANIYSDYIGEAYYLLGSCFEKGLGCPKDKKKAKEYYQKADSNGYKNSKAKKFFW